MISGRRVVPSIDEWLAHEGYRALLTPDQWQRLVSTVRGAAPAYLQPEIEARERLSELRRLLIAHFNEEELRDFCFRLDIEYEDLGGTARKDKVRELVTYGRRHGRIQEMWELCFKLRPHLSQS